MNISLRAAFPTKAGAVVLLCGAVAFGQNLNTSVAAGPLQHGVMWKQSTSSASGVQAAAPVQNAAATAHLTYYGGPIVQHPVFVNVSWGPNVGSYGVQLDAFVNQVACSAEWTSTMAQYTGGSGPLTHIEPGTFWGSRVLTPDTSATTIDDSAIQSQIAKWIAAGKLPPNDGNTIYSILFPPGIKVTQGGTSSCVSGGFCAYHGTSAGANGKDILYAVLPDQGPGSGCNAGCGGSTLLNNVTSVLSHELAETITDPEVGFAQDYAPPLAWYDVTNGEIGDICNASQGTLLGWTVQREWSNVDNACVTQSQGFSVKAGSVTIAPGQTGYVTVTTQSIGGFPPYLTFGVSGLPAGVTGGFTPVTGGAGSSTTLYLIVGSGVVPGVYSASVTASAGVIQHASTLTLTISGSQQSQTITFSALSNRALGSAPFTVSATASSGLPVSFASITPAVCTVSGTTVTLAAAGQCSIMAAQAGNASYTAAPSVTQSFQVTSGAQTITFNPLPNQTLGTPPFAISATASSGLPVSFASNSPGVCSVSGNTVSLVFTGQCSITASQPGNGSYTAAPSVTQTFQVTSSAGQTINFAALPSRPFGTAPFAISATASSGLPVSFASMTPSVCTISGSTVTLVSVGQCGIQATQPGNGTVPPAPAVTQTFQVTQGSQTISFSALANKPIGSAPFAISASASSGLPVSFSSNTSQVCTVSGSTVSLVAAGQCGIQASQTGNANYTAAPSVTQSFQVTQASQPSQTITFNPLPDRPLYPSSFQVNATASSGLPVTFASLTPSNCFLFSNTVYVMSMGTCAIQATQAGDGVYGAATPVTQSFQVNRWF